MTTDLARIDSNAALALSNGHDALSRLGQWVTAANQAHQLVAPLVDTPFVPDAYRPKIDPRATADEKAAARNVAVANATAAVLQGISLGLDPLTALQQIYIVHGRPGMYARAMVALVVAAGHEVWTEDISDTRAIVCGRRNGQSQIERVTVTMQQAQTAGWASRNANYKTVPQDMLWARAAGRVCNRIAPDRLLGIASVEEIQDTVQASVDVGPASTRTVQPPRRRALPPAAPPGPAEEPPLDDGPATEPEQAPAAEPGITQAQSRKMYALLRETGREDKDVALVYISGVTGRPIESTKELTKREAIRVIDALETPAQPADGPPLDGELLDGWPEAARPADSETTP